MQSTKLTNVHPSHIALHSAHFSAITPKDIQNALQNLGVPNKNEALSVDAR